MNTIKYFFAELLSTDDFPARWFCGKWSDFHGWLYILSNFIIWASYFAIPISLIYFIIKRDDLPLKKVFVLFIFFILFCGATHFIDALIFWIPIYRLNAVMLFFTAIVSSITAVTMFKEIPKAAQLKTPKQLQEIIDQKTKELKKANAELEKSKDIFKKLVDNNPDVISRLNEDYIHLFMNKSVTDFSDLEPEFYIGKSYKDLNYPASTKNFLENNIDKSLQENKIVKAKLAAKDGKDILHVHEVVFVPLERTAEEEKREVITIARDITKEEETKKSLDQKVKELNEQSSALKQQYKQLEDFSYIVSHNLRSPVGNLNALYDMMEEEEDEAVKGMLYDNTKKVAANLKQTIQDLTELINIKLNKDPKTNLISVKEIFDKVEESLKNEIKAKDAKVKVDFQVSDLHFNKVYMESILQNLFTNALKYSSPKRKPEIWFKTQKVKGGVELICQDNGKGLDMERFGKKLFKLNKTFHGNQDARGVGLFITKSQLEACGGSITAEGEVDKGMKFTIFIPDTA